MYSKRNSPGLNLRRQRGSILVMTLVLTGLIGFSLASYLTLVSAQNRSVVRSQTWNSAIPVIEAGIEEALAHLNRNGLTNLSTQGWRSHDGCVTKKRWVGNQRYTVAIFLTARPMIECTGYAPAPILFAQSGGSLFGQVGTMGFNAKTYICRTVQVQTQGGPLFGRGIVSKGSIDMNGNHVSTDSFDSADANFSTNGRYDKAKRNDNGDVATNAGGDVLNAGNANIMGKVATGPGGTITAGANSSIGTKAWVQAGKLGIEAGRFSDNMNMDFPDVRAPFNSGKSPYYNTPITTTNISYGVGTVTVATSPSPLPSGPITTNYGLLTTETYPSPVPLSGVATSYVGKVSTDYPTNAIGPVCTNSTLVVNSPTLPNPRPMSVIWVMTNVITVTNGTLPSAAVSVMLATNTVPCTVAYPNSPMPDQFTDPGAWTPPAPGTCVGTVTRYYQMGNPKGWYQDYQAIQSYVYQTLIYSIAYSGAYAYTNLAYTYNVAQSYSYQVCTTTNVTISTTTYDMVFYQGDYVVFSLGGSVYVDGNVRLLVTDSMDFTGKSGITIGPNGTLQLYMAGASANIGGQGIMNQNGNAASFSYYGLPGNTALAIQGNGSFTGNIYAPNAALNLRGGGNNTEDFIGATVSASIAMNGHFNFHYDENSARRGPQHLYVTAWNEIGPGEARIHGNPGWVFADDETGY